MFIGRERELHALEKLYQSDHFEFAVIYGRRRVGKTALISYLLKDKKCIFFTGIETNSKQNLENLSRTIAEFVTGLPADTVFSSFQAALEYVFKLAEKERIVLVIDEYPYVARSSGSFASTLQLLIDQYKEHSQLFLILCGSSMSYMEDHVLAYKAPLYGRRTAQLKLLPFSFKEALPHLANFLPEERALLYGVVGGTPQYLLQIRTDLSVEENIKQLFLNPMSAIFEEPENLLKQEVREPALYNAIITSIAGGASRMAEIATKVGESPSVCSMYLKNLVSLGIVKKGTPYGEKASRKSVYALDDNLFRFWFRFIPSNISVIARGAADLAYRRIEPQLSDYMGRIFEDLCRQYLWELLLSGRSPVEFTELGRWWGTDPRTHAQTEIDLMATGDNGSALFGECKWTTEPADVSVLRTLLERSRLFHYDAPHLYLFSKSGFTTGCIAEAGHLNNIHLISYAEMF